MSNQNPVETTRDLLTGAQCGDIDARDRLLRRYLPILTRWAHGRLPVATRNVNETADLVQVTLIRAFENISTFEARGQGAFFAYLRHIMSNLIRDEFRGSGRRPAHEELSVDLSAPGPSPEHEAIGAETLDAYERALQTMDAEDRELVIMRVELGLSNEEIALTSSAPTVNAARMRLARAMVHLADLMDQQPP